MYLSRRFSGVTLCGFLLCLTAAPQQSPPQKSAPPQAAPQPAAPQSGAPRQVSPQQAAPDADTHRIRVQSTEVIVPVTVTDEKGKFVSNLVARDFRVLDEGKPQRISYFSHDQNQPIVVGFLVDQSNGMRIHWKTYQEAVKNLIWGLLPGDKKYTGYLIGYSNQAELIMNTTSDGDAMAEKLDKMKPGGGAALFDAIYQACTKREVVAGEPYEPRRVIIVVGDGHDTASDKSLEEVVELAQRNLVTIYAVSTQSFGFANDSQDVLDRLTIETGGHVEYPLNTLYKDVSGYLSNPSDEGNYALKVGTGGYASEISSSIFKAVGGIQGEITTQYVLRYHPDVDAEVKPKIYRHIKIEIPMLPSVTINARKGYYPNGVPGSTTAAPSGQ